MPLTQLYISAPSNLLDRELRKPSPHVYPEASLCWVWFTGDGGSRGDFGLADLRHYRAANDSGSNSWKKEQEDEEEEEEEEACRNWLRSCSFWRENKFDLLSLNNNRNTWSSSCCSLRDWMWAGPLRATDPLSYRPEHRHIKYLSSLPACGVPVLLRAPWMIKGFPSQMAPLNTCECKEKKSACVLKILLPCQQLSTNQNWEDGERESAEEGKMGRQSLTLI